MSEAIHLTLLGPIDLRKADGREVRSVLAQPKRVALLAFLCVEGRSGSIPRDRVIGLLWPETTEDRARSSLRTALYQLRQSLGSDAIETLGTDLRIDLAILSCDAARLLDAAAARDHATVVDLFQGDFMEGFHLSDAAEFDRWMEGRRSEVHRAVVAAATALDPTNPDAMRILAWLVERRPGEERAVQHYLEGVHRTRGAGAARGLHASWSEAYRERFEQDPDPSALELLDRLDQEGGPKTPATQGPAPAPLRPSGARPVRSRPRPGLALATTLMAAILVAAAGALLILAPTAPEPGEGTGIAVASFQVRDSESRDYLGPLTGLLLGRELDGSGSPLVWPGGVGSTPEGCSPSSSEPQSRISGVVGVEGQTVTIRACLLQESGVTRSWRVGGPVTALEEVVGTLAGEVRTSLGLPLPDESTPALSAAPGAYPAFVEGEQERLAGRFSEAMGAYDRALAVDSTFAWAHYRRSTSAEWLGHAGDAKEAADRALAHSVRLTPRERVLLDAWRSYLWGDVEQARTAYVSLVHQRPTDPDVWGRLAELRFHWGSRLGIPDDSADAAFRRVLELTPDHAPALLHRMRLLGREAGLAEVEDLASRISALDVPESEGLEVAAIVALRRGDEEALRREVVPWVLDTNSVIESARLGGLLAATAEPVALERLIALLPPTSDETRRTLREILLVYTAAMEGRPGLARERVSRLGRDHPARAAELSAMLTMLPTAAADPAAIQEALAGIRGVAPPSIPMGSRVKYASFEGIFPPRRIFLDAALSSRLPDPPDSARYRSELNASNDLFKADYLRLVDGFHWAWHREPERVLNAIREGALPPDRVLSDVLDYATAMERWLRVEALRQLGREDDALRWLRTFPGHTGYDAAWLPAAWVVEGEILEKRGLIREARERFRHALALWRDAEPEMDPWVGRARAGLQRSGG